MNIEVIDQLIQDTSEGHLEWESSSNPFENCAFFERKRYSIEYIPSAESGSYALYEWDERGDIKDSLAGRQDCMLQNRLKQLYEYVLRSKKELYDRHYTFYGKLQEKNRKKMKETNYLVSLYKIMVRLGYESAIERPDIHINTSKSFYYKEDDAESFVFKYVQPPMSQLSTSQGMTPCQDAEVVLISAPGATGKTAMSNYLSSQLRIPILDLGKHDAVGANSISGLLMQTINREDVFIYHNGLVNGLCSMIIDGLDEASIHISWESFEAFLKNVAFFAKGAKGLPFVILGRPGVMEDAALVLEENDVKVSLLQIEPFTTKNAKEFIDNQMPQNYITSFYQQYRDVRDYIIEQIGGFFKNESELNKKLFEHFIGYAPVLQSISNLLKEEKDFHRLLDDLKNDNKQKIELLIDIVQRIMKREQGKIHAEVLPQLFEPGRPKTFISEITNASGGEVEQCRRILARFLGKEAIVNIANEKAFDEKYNEKNNQWIKNHPFFLGNENKIQNIVFESYLIATLIDKEECREDVLDYLICTGSCSYLLLDIYTAVNGHQTKEIDHRFFSFLYDSFKALEHPQDWGTTEIEGDVEDNGSIKCYLSFGRNESAIENDFTFIIGNDEWLSLPSNLSYLNIDAPINIEISGNKVDLQAPVSIRCQALKVASKDVLLSTPNGTSDSIVLESRIFETKCRDESIPSLKLRTPAVNNRLMVITETEIGYPFREYLKKPSPQLGIDRHLAETYQKMRRMILMFRSHSKGKLGRYCEKIDNRIGKSPLGAALIDELIHLGVLYTDNMMYFINIEKFGEVFGAKYDDIRSSDINEKTMLFLESFITQNKSILS